MADSDTDKEGETHDNSTVTDGGNSNTNSGTDSTSSSGTNGTDEIRQIIREELAKIRRPNASPNITRRVDIEAEAERMVKEAAEKLTKETEIKELKDKVETLVTETAPVKVRRLTKFLWGDDNK